MGAAVAKKLTGNSGKHKNCDCILYDNYSHCCTKQCFGGNRDNIKHRLFTALKQYEAEYFIDIIMSYLPTSLKFEIINMNAPAALFHYYAFSYSPIAKLCNNDKRVCPVWIKHYIESHKSVNDIPEIKVIMLGNSGTGKTTLICRFETGDFEDHRSKHSLMMDTFKKEITVNGQKVLINILDTEHSALMQDEWIRETQIFVLCFHNKHSFEHIHIYKELILRIKDKNDNKWGMILCATKCDDPHLLRTERKIVIEKAKEWNVPYIETSARDDKNVNFLFEQILYTLWITSTTHCVNLN